MTVTNEHIFKSAFNPAFPRQISKYYNHYEIGEFPPRLCLLNAIGQKKLYHIRIKNVITVFVNINRFVNNLVQRGVGGKYKSNI